MIIRPYIVKIHFKSLQFHPIIEILRAHEP